MSSPLSKFSFLKTLISNNSKFLSWHDFEINDSDFWFSAFGSYLSVDWALCADVLPNIKQHAAKDMVYLTFSLSLHFFPRSRSNKQIDILFCCCWHKHDKIEMEWSFFEMLGSVAYCIDITTIFGCTDCWFCPCLAWYTYSIQHNPTQSHSHMITNKSQVIYIFWSLTIFLKWMNSKVRTCLNITNRLDICYYSLFLHCSLGPQAFVCPGSRM